MFKTKEQQGITLISLVITIIILLILAAVAINLAVDSNGLFKKAGDAANSWNTSVAEEEDILSDLMHQINVYTPIELTDIYVALYTDGTLVFNNKNEFDTNLISKEYGNIKGSHYIYYVDDEHLPPWYDEHRSITTVTFLNEIVPENTSAWFADFFYLTTINNIENLNTAMVQDMSDMFTYCEELTISNLDLSNFNTCRVTNMEDMFLGCMELTSLNLSYFDTNSEKNMKGMFAECHCLTSLNLSNLDTSNVTDMSNMFWGCYELTSLDLSNFNTSNVTDMENMFDNCWALTSLDLSNFETSNVTDMQGMFTGCRGLTSLDVSNFDTSNVTSMDYMFWNVTASVTVGENWNPAMTEAATGYAGTFTKVQ